MIEYKLESLSIEYDHADKMLQDDLQVNTEPISRPGPCREGDLERSKVITVIKNLSIRGVDSGKVN